MGHAKGVRVIKGGRAARGAEAAPGAESAPDAGREVREVVSDWVREHRRRSDEFRRNYSSLLGAMGLKAPSFGGRAA